MASLTSLGSASRTRTLRACLQTANEVEYSAPQPTRICPVPPHATVVFGASNQRRRRGMSGERLSESTESTFSPSRSPGHSFGGRWEQSPRSAAASTFHQASPRGAVVDSSCARSPPTIVGFNPKPVVSQTMGVRFDPGSEIMSILSARREEQARTWLGAVSPPSRASNPVSNDCRFRLSNNSEAHGLSNALGGWNI